jgi:hypothetical protein
LSFSSLETIGNRLEDLLDGAEVNALLDGLDGVEDPGSRDRVVDDAEEVREVQSPQEAQLALECVKRLNYVEVALPLCGSVLLLGILIVGAVFVAVQYATEVYDEALRHWSCASGGLAGPAAAASMAGRWLPERSTCIARSSTGSCRRP